MSWQSRVGNWLVSQTLRRSITGVGFATATRRFGVMLELAAFFLPWPKETRRTPAMYRGVPCEWIDCCSEPSADGPAIIYLHGGAFAMGSIRTHRDIARRLAAASGFRVLLVEYRLAPANPFPAAVDDVLSVYEALRDAGIERRPLAFAGDSAGGNLALVATNRILAQGLDPPFALALFSPWLDLAASGRHRGDGVESEYMLNEAFLASAAREYANGVNLKDPRISPLRGSLERLPPMHICAAAGELFRSDAKRLARSAEREGGAVELRLWAGQMHAFPTFAAVLPEGRRAVREAAAFLLKHGRTVTGA